MAVSDVWHIHTLGPRYMYMPYITHCHAISITYTSSLTLQGYIHKLSHTKRLPTQALSHYKATYTAASEAKEK